jgi:hypothetical protein
MNITIPTIAAVSAALILAPSARAPSPKAEAHFIEDLDMLGLNPCTMRLPGGLEEEVKIGHAICTDLLNEADPYQELAALVKDVPALTQQAGQDLMVASVSDICPDYPKLLPWVPMPNG